MYEPKPVSRNKLGIKDIRRSLKNENEINLEFINIVEKTLIHENISVYESDYLLRIIALCLMSDDESTNKMAYNLAIHYGIATGDYSVLHDIATRFRYFPVVDLIERNNGDMNADVISTALLNAYKEDFVQSEEQYYFGKIVKTRNNIRAIAPTSYGKSNLMISKSLDYFSKNHIVCIVVPTKSLLAQIVSRISKIKGDRKNVVTHPDMLTDRLVSGPFIGVLTQERLMSILTKWENLKIDCILVDEAHEILSKEERSTILARDLVIARARNPRMSIEYYSPFIASPETSLNLISEETENAAVVEIKEFMKIPQFLLWEYDKTTISLYDQFLDRFIKYDDATDDIYTTTIKYSAKKNIIYANKPVDIETIAEHIAEANKNTVFSPNSQEKIKKATDAIAKSIHCSYNLINLLKRGVVISHGRMTDSTRRYCEYLFAEIPEIKFIVTTSTLLEGVNIPAEKLFIYDLGKGLGYLSSSEFLNLSGRVARFKEVFGDNSTSVAGLAPQIFVMKNNIFMRKNADCENYLKNNVREGVSHEDIVLNPLMQKYNQIDKQERLLRESTILGNMDSKRVKTYSKISGAEPTISRTRFGELCFKHGARFFNILDSEKFIEHRLANIEKISDATSLMECIVKNVLAPTYSAESMRRSGWIYGLYTNEWFRNRMARVIENKTSGNYNFARLVAAMTNEWKRRLAEENGSFIAYVGGIGDCGRNGQMLRTGNSWHRFNAADEKFLVSYAVSLEKENLDSIENNLMPLVEVLNDLGKVDDSFYKKIKYGTDNDFVIDLIKLGAELSLAESINDEKELKRLFQYTDNGLICINLEKLINEMTKKDFSDIFINDAKEIF